MAAHYVEAFEATPDGPDADALAARARDWLRQASDRAVSLGSAEQALAFTEQALALTEGGDERIALLRLAADAAGDAVRPEDRERYLREAAALARGAGDRIGEAQILREVIETLSGGDKTAAAAELAEAVASEFEDAKEAEIREVVVGAICELAYLRGDCATCLRTLDEQLAQLESLGDTTRLMRTIGIKAIALGLVGRHREAGVLARGHVETVRLEGDRRLLVESLGFASLVLTEDDPRGALDALLEAIAVARKAGYGRDEVASLANGIEAAVELGEWEVAGEMLARLREMPSLPASEAGFVSLGVALLAAYRGDHDAASAALDSVEEPGNPMGRAWLHRARSVALTQGGNPSEGYDAAMDAIAEQPSGPNSPFALWSAGRAALWSPERLPLAIERIRTALDATTACRGDLGGERSDEPGGCRGGPRRAPPRGGRWLHECAEGLDGNEASLRLRDDCRRRGGGARCRRAALRRDRRSEGVPRADRRRAPALALRGCKGRLALIAR